MFLRLEQKYMERYKRESIRIACAPLRKARARELTRAESRLIVKEMNLDLGTKRSEES